MNAGGLTAVAIVTASRLHPGLLSLHTPKTKQFPEGGSILRALMAEGFREGDEIAIRLVRRPMGTMPGPIGDSWTGH